MRHGGDVERVARESGLAADAILDFSANVNPMGLPPRALERLAREAREVRVLTEYPDPEASGLRAVLSERLGVAAERIAIGAGADALIHAAVRALAPGRCIIPSPAFSEYERACEAFGCAVHRVGLTREAAMQVVERGDLVILNNPHNPTGQCLSRGEMRERVSGMRGAGATVLVDEAFIDYVPEAAITNEAAAEEGVIAIRSLTKFFGCPGLRVGYAVSGRETALRLSAQLPAWPVTTLALHALEEALRDEQHERATLENNARARTSLVEALVRLRCEVFPPSANFILFEVPKTARAAEVRKRLLAEHAVLVRECDSFHGLEKGRYLRVAVRREGENQRLIEGLAKVLEGTA